MINLFFSNHFIFKTMKKNALFIISWIVLINHLTAQRGSFNQGAPFREQTLMQFPSAIDASNAKQIKGSRFYNPEYRKGELWASNGLHCTDELEYKFDEVENSVQVKTKSGKELLLDANSIDSFRLYVDDTTTIYYYKAPLPDSKRAENKIFQVVYVGNKILLFKIPQKVMKNLNYKGSFGDGRTLGEYVPRHQYYIKAGNKPLTSVKLNKKDLVNKIPFKKGELTELLEYVEFYEELTEKKVLDIIHKIDK